MKRRKTAQCEAPGCTNKPFKQVLILDHLFEGLWCCEECIKDPLGLKKNHERTELNVLTDELKVKREEYLVIKRIGGWSCPASPTGSCVYDCNDTMHEHCLFCGNPEERK